MNETQVVGPPRKTLNRPNQRALDLVRAECDAVISHMKTTSTYGWLRLTDMKVDPRAQRLLRRVWVKRHVPQFDGQHRVELLRAVGWEDQLVYCEIFDSIAIKEEAALFLRRNDKISVRTFDKFAVSLTEQDPSSCAIAKIVADQGLAIAEGKRDGHVSAVTALQHIYSGASVTSQKEGVVALRKTLQTIEAAWGRLGTNFQGQIVEGIGLIFLRYGNKIDEPALIAKLAKVGGGAAGLIGQARSLRDLHGGTAAYCVGAVIVQRYNRGRRSGKLESWWS